MFLYISSIKYKKSDIKNMITTATETEGALPVIIWGIHGGRKSWQMFTRSTSSIFRLFRQSLSPNLQTCNKKTYPWYAGLRSTNGYTVVFRSKILVLISNSGNDVIHQVKQRQWVFPEKKLNLPWKRKCLILKFWNQHNINILIRCGFSGILYLKVSLKTVWNT